MNFVGIDIVDLDDIDSLVMDNLFLLRFFADSEIAEFQKQQTILLKKRFLASRWALKEAIYKAIPQEKLSFKEIIIAKNFAQQPTVAVKNYQFNLSISYSKKIVVAVAVGNKE